MARKMEFHYIESYSSYGERTQVVDVLKIHILSVNWSFMQIFQ